MMPSGSENRSVKVTVLSTMFEIGSGKGFFFASLNFVPGTQPLEY